MVTATHASSNSAQNYIASILEVLITVRPIEISGALAQCACVNSYLRA